MIISFVILHYENLTVTKQCIDSLLKLNVGSNEFNIICVDNGSKIGKVEQIENIYPTVNFVHSKENLGFAKGNNLGYMIAKEKYQSNIIGLLNNDIIIEQENFLLKLIDEFENKKFDIAGPNVLSYYSKTPQNPIIDLYLTSKKISKRILKYRILNLLAIFNLDKVFQSIFLKTTKKEIQDLYTDKEDYKLHGCALFFTQNYIDNYDGLNKETFMYYEEDFLKFRAVKDNLKMVYLKELTLYHMEEATTNYVQQSKRKKRLFRYKHSINSLKILYKMVKDYEKKFL